MKTVELTDKQIGQLLQQALEQQYKLPVASMNIKLNSEAIMVPTHVSVIVTFKEGAA